MKWEKLFNLFCLILVVGGSIVFWWPTRELPYWWDSAGFIMHGAKYYLETNFQSFILPSDSAISAMAHPPLFSFLLALTWKIFGQSLLVSHLFYLPFILLAGIFAYLLGRKMANANDESIRCLTGILIFLLLFFSPVFLAQVGIIYPEIPVAAFALMAIYFFFERRAMPYFLSASLMLFMKEVSVVVILAVLAVIFLRHLSKFFRTRQIDFKVVGKELIIFGSPLLLLVGWFVWHKSATGWMFAMPYYQSRFSQNVFTLSLQSFVFVLKFFFFDQGRFLLTIISPILIFFLLIKKEGRKSLFREEVFVIFLIAILVPLLFGKLEFLNRYIIFGLPFFYIFFFFLLTSFLKSKIAGEQVTIFGIITFIILFSFHSSWDNHREIKEWHFSPLEENLEYRDVINIGKQMVGFIERYYPEANIWTAFPSNYMLSQPFQGYATKTLRVHNCKDFKAGEQVDLIVFDLLSPTQRDCLAMIKAFNFTILLPFGQNGKWLQVYKSP